jgi:protein deglycase
VTRPGTAGRSVCVLLAEGFEELEAITILDVLRRAELDVTSVGVGGTSVRGAHGIVVQADVPLADIGGRRWDLVVLPGGMPGAANLRDSKGVQALVKEQHARGGMLGAICAAPIALAAAGVLAGRRATSYPGFGDQLVGAKYSEDNVVVDGHIITSRGPGTALPFALRLVAELCGASMSASVGQAMLVGAGR